MSSIDPKCQSTDINYHVEINGMFLPCCWLATHRESIKDLRERLGDDYDLLFLTNNDPHSIIDLWEKHIESSWETDTPVPMCKIKCTKKRNGNGV